MPNQYADPGYVYVCAACGKRSRDTYGNTPLVPGWDVSCTMNAILCREDKITVNQDGLVVHIDEDCVVGNPL